MPNDPEQPKSPEETAPPLLGRVSRRSFLSHLGAAGIGAAGIAATASPVLAASASAAVQDAPIAAAPAGTMPVVLKVNGKQHTLHLDPRTTLLDALRENMNLPGTKKGCDHGQCGACTVLVNGRRVNSCLSFAAMHPGDEITTIEGLGQPGNLHPMQASFVEHDAYQCGYCTSGQIVSAVALKEEGLPTATEKDVQNAMYGNICRCGAYPNIVKAVQAVYQRA